MKTLFKIMTMQPPYDSEHWVPFCMLAWLNVAGFFFCWVLAPYKHYVVAWWNFWSN